MAIQSANRRRALPPYCVEKVKWQQFREVSDLQHAGDRSLATVLASPGWQEFYLQVNVPAFFNTTGRQLPLRFDCLYFSSKTFKIPKQFQFAVASIPAVSTTE
ncbi:hypothetical protein [Janthinobacterium sp. 78]|uniref:hypothetical protein n=1 Tax=Janthinobacterium sp. 78 TaxID=2135631 RepID=UPI001057FF10|nr:hypothetical protein [Janthinobacterium sp. 78]